MTRLPQFENMVAEAVDKELRHRAEQIEARLQRAWERNEWPVDIDEVDLFGQKQTIRYLRPGFWLRLRIRWALWKQ